MWTVNLILLVLVSVVTSQEDNLIVSTPLGDILGSTLTSRLNKTIYAFRGIRYAQPPVGELRFEPPVPIEPWSGVYNATVDGPVCPQPTDDPVSEDCLLLNVYTTKLPDDDTNPKRSVIVYIHAGGFYSVTGRSNWGGPQYFLDHDIVLVTFNYRLGTLGFINTGRSSPGNNGLKDQVIALRWVRDNIESFGGDPNSVTLFGYSAGSFSINLHLVSPMSRGLFHRAIMGSGSALGQISLPNNVFHEQLARKQARFVGCPAEAALEVVLICLKSIPAVVLGNTLDDFAEFSNDPVLIWWPAVEGDYGQERFLTEQPLTTFQRGDFQHIPLISGVTKDEFAYRAFPVAANETLLNLLSDNFEIYAPICFLYERGGDWSHELSASLREFYLGNDPLTNASLTNLSKLYADSITGFPVNRAVSLLSELNSENVYYYEFTYQGRFSHFELPGTTEPYGVVHHDDLIYLFYISAIFPFFDETYPESEMVEKLTLLWATFAQTGTPIPESSQIFQGINWEPYNTTTRRYLDIGQNITLKEGLYHERYDFWDKLIPLET